MGFVGQARGDRVAGRRDVIGPVGIDRLMGDGQANIPIGAGKFDIPGGGAGSDRVSCGIGVAGDRFVFNPAVGTATIADFEIGPAHLDLWSHGFATWWRSCFGSWWGMGG